MLLSHLKRLTLDFTKNNEWNLIWKKNMKITVSCWWIELIFVRQRFERDKCVQKNENHNDWRQNAPACAPIFTWISTNHKFCITTQSIDACRIVQMKFWIWHKSSINFCYFGAYLIYFRFIARFYLLFYLIFILIGILFSLRRRQKLYQKNTQFKKMKTDMFQCFFLHIHSWEQWMFCRE